MSAAAHWHGPGTLQLLGPDVLLRTGIAGQILTGRSDGSSSKSLGVKTTAHWAPWLLAAG